VWFGKLNAMQSKSSASTLLVILLIFLTFPIWLGISGGVLGLMAGLMAAIFGIFAGIFGAAFGVIGSMFHWHWPFGGFFHWNFLTIILIVGIIVFISRSKKG